MDKKSFIRSTPSNQLILLCSRIRIDETQKKQIEKVIEDKDFNWNQILDNAFKNSILPYVYYHLKTLGIISKVPEEIVKKFEKFYHFNTARNTWILLSLEKIAEVFNKNNIPFMLIQGSSLLADVYS